MVLDTNPRDWSDTDVAAWLRSEQLDRFESLFHEHDICGEVLVELTYPLLADLGIRSVGEKVRLITAIDRLRMRYADVLAQWDEVVPVVQVNGARGGHSGDERSDGSSLFEAAEAPVVAPVVLDAIRQNFIRVMGDEGQSCVVDVRGLQDAASILSAVLHKFHIQDDATASYQLFAVLGGGETRVLSDAELVAICKTPGRPERDRLILRRRYQFVSHGEFKKKHKNRKLEMFFGEKLPLPSPGGHRDSFIGSVRPASELISMNLAEFFPETAQAELENVGEIIKRKSMMMYDLPPATIALAAATTQRRSSTWKRLTSNEEAIEEEGEEGRRTPAKPLPLVTEVPVAVDPVAEPEVVVVATQATVITKWIQGALIGTGSFGNVYLGLNSVNGELLAAKQVELPKDGRNDERKQMMLTALQREISLLKDLNHENIVRYLGSQIDENYLNIFLEYVPGGSVASLLANYGAFEEPLVKSYVRQILQGLCYLHERDIIHRDIKGGNVLVDNKGVIKISDFGISQRVEEGVIGQGSVANRASLQGSVFWMAPEVVKSQHYTFKADVWSLGCLIIEMFTGDHPFPKFTQMQAIFKIGMDVAPDIPENLSKEAEEFLQRTFELDHVKRPNASELLQHAFVMVP